MKKLVCLFMTALSSSSCVRSPHQYSSSTYGLSLGFEERLDFYPSSQTAVIEVLSSLGSNEKGGSLDIYAGDGTGSENGGGIVIEGGSHGPDGGINGAISIGTTSTTDQLNLGRPGTILHVQGDIYDDLNFSSSTGNHRLSVNPPTSASSGLSMTVQGGTGGSGSRGGYLYMVGGDGGPGGNGSDVYLVGGRKDPAGLYGGSIHINGSPSAVSSNNGNVRIAEDADTYSVQVGSANTLVSFFSSNAVPQQSSSGEVSGFVAGSGVSMSVDSTSTGGVGTTAYTQGDIVAALKNYGLLAK